MGPLSGKYLVKNRFGNLILRIFDFLCMIIVKFAPRRGEIKTDKILLSNIAHMGDLVIATKMLPVLKANFPKSKIGFICGSWAETVLKSNPMIDHIYILDHWKINRTKCFIYKKIWGYLKTKRRVLRELKLEKWDIAIDLYYYFPNTIPLLWQAKIPVRIGYISGGFGKLLTHPHIWKNEYKHMSVYNLDLLKTLFNKINFSNNENRLPSLSYDKIEKLKEKMQNVENYTVFHVGSDNQDKEWSLNNWRELAKTLTHEGKTIVFTGRGERENALISSIITQITLDSPLDALNLCNKLSFDEFVFVISKAKMLISIDSVGIHIAAAFNIPTIVLFCGINNKAHIIDPSSPTISITKELPCTPCHNKRGCKDMSCIKDIKVEEVISAIKILQDKYGAK